MVRGQDERGWMDGWMVGWSDDGWVNVLLRARRADEGHVELRRAAQQVAHAVRPLQAGGRTTSRRASARRAATGTARARWGAPRGHCRSAPAVATWPLMRVPSPQRVYEWGQKSKRRRTTGTGRMRHLKLVRRRFRNGFRSVCAACASAAAAARACWGSWSVGLVGADGAGMGRWPSRRRRAAASPSRDKQRGAAQRWRLGPMARPR